ncbi:hypothetical protein OG948_31720 [Embleya sp. NBC_00888]|uniref:hypothetical protein n=1 Tax=Embleya sp. NBC_00888 TaxID=2975960 RepID=UPI0038634424|nr:hypothetical protein OG948_31720 [Embleya sp. NBC_00888]
MSRGLALPGAAAGVLAAVVSAIIALTACGADESDPGTHELGTIAPAAAPGPTAPGSPFTSTVVGARNTIRHACVDVEKPLQP